MHFICKGLKSIDHKHVTSCPICKKQKTLTNQYGHLPPSTANFHPWECVHIDLFGPQSFTCNPGKTHQIHDVSIIDSGLHWIELHEYSSKTSEDVSLLFDHKWLCRYPRPRMVVFDNGTEFTSIFHELLDSYGIQSKATTIKNPQSNVIIECVHLTIGDSLHAMDLSSCPFDDTSIHGILQSIVWGLCTTYHMSLRNSPGQLAFGQDMVIPVTYLANWRHIIALEEASVLSQFDTL
jgi:transposase InsO family protein